MLLSFDDAGRIGWTTIEGSARLIDYLGGQGIRFCWSAVPPLPRSWPSSASRKHRTNPSIALSRRNSLDEAFNEDLAIIEAQQKVFDADPNYQLLAIGADAALTCFRWLPARRIEAEGSAARAV